MTQEELEGLTDEMAEQVEPEDGWSFMQVWNAGMEKADERQYEPRNYIWASELGKLQSDVFLKMKGVTPTNPPNARSLRKFEAGNLWEWIVKIVLIRAGILIETQKKIKVGYPGMIEVSGKLDFYAGGVVDATKAQNAIDELYLPEKTQAVMANVVKYLAATYPDGLSKKALEIKSVSSHMMNALEITKQPLEIHALQAYHYTKDEEIDRADVVYICRDDCRMMEFPIFAGNEKYEAIYKKYVAEMTEFYQTDTEPPKAKPIVFNEVAGKFELNRLIGWSPYLTLTYGYADQLEFDEKYKAIPPSWNRVLKRIKNGEKLTANNAEKIEEMSLYGFDAHDLASKLVDTPEEDAGDTD